MSSNYEDVDYENNEDIERAELICQHKKQKLFPQWMEIAYAVDSLEDEAADMADVERDWDLNYRKSKKYHSALESLRKTYSNLLGFDTETHARLLWLARHGSQLDQWHERISELDQAKLYDPKVIQKLYQANEATRM